MASLGGSRTSSGPSSNASQKATKGHGACDHGCRPPEGQSSTTVSETPTMGTVAAAYTTCRGPQRGPLTPDMEAPQRKGFPSLGPAWLCPSSSRHLEAVQHPVTSRPSSVPASRSCASAPPCPHLRDLKPDRTAEVARAPVSTLFPSRLGQSWLLREHLHSTLSPRHKGLAEATKERWHRPQDGRCAEVCRGAGLPRPLLLQSPVPGLL